MIVLAALVVVGLGHSLILCMLAWPLVAGSSSLSADYYAIQGGELGSDGFQTFDVVADWQGRGANRKIVLLAPRTSRIVEIGALRSFEEMCQGELSKRGLPPADVWPTHADAGDVWGAAHALHDWLHSHPESTVSIPCSPFGSGRQRYVLNKVLGPMDAERVRLTILPNPGCRVESWWRSRQGVKEFMFSWLELMYAWTEGDRSPPDLPNAAKFQEEVRAKIGEVPR